MNGGFTIGLFGGAAVLSLPLIGTILGRGSMSSEPEVSFLFGASVYCGIGLLVYFCYLSEVSIERDDPFFRFCKELATRLGGAILGASIPFAAAFALERMAAHVIGY